MSTAPTLARLHLRNLARNLATPSSASSFHTARPRSSAWPAGSAGSEDQDDHFDLPRRPSPSPASSSPSSSSSSSRQPVASPRLRNRAGPAMQDSPPPASNTHHPAHSSVAAAQHGTPSSSSSSKGKAKAPSAAAVDAQLQPRSSRLPPPPRRKTLAYLGRMKQEGTKVACLTAYDYPTGLAMRYADVDLVLIGDSLANVALGHSTTQPLSLDAIIHHSQAVQRGLNSAILLAQESTPAAPLVFADMPFGTFVASDAGAVDNVVRLMQETGVDGVKIEGAEEVMPLIRRLTSFGIPVIGHLGLQPQRVGATSGYRVQGKSAQQARDIFESAKRLEEAGCFAIVLECIPNKLARYISERIDAITIGIGAGSGTDGQILVVSDMMGELTSPAHILAGLASGGEGEREGEGSTASVAQPHADAPRPPKFVRSFVRGSSVGAMRLAAVSAYVDAVRDQTFPDDEREGYKIKSDEWRAFVDLVEGGEGEGQEATKAAKVAAAEQQL